MYFLIKDFLLMNVKNLWYSTMLREKFQTFNSIFVANKRFCLWGSISDVRLSENKLSTKSLEIA